jgi:ATP-binding cassette subfamily C protein
VIRGFLADLAAYQPVLLVSVLLLMFARSLTESLTFVALIPLLELTGATSLTTDAGWLQGSLHGLQEALGVRLGLEAVLAVFLSLIILRAVLGYFGTMTTERWLAGYIDHARQRTYRALSRSSWLHMAGARQSHDTHALTMQVEAVEGAASSALSLVAALCTVVLGLAVALAVSPALALTVIGSSVLLAVPLMAYQRLAYRRGQSTVQAVQHLYEVIAARLGGLKLAKAFAIERQLEQDFASSSGALRDATIAARETAARANLIQETGAALILVVFVYTGFRLLGAPGLEMVMLVAIFSRLLPLVIGIERSLRGLFGILPHYQSLRALEARARAAEETLPDPVVPIALTTSIEFRHVGFSFPASEAAALHDITLRLPARSATGIIGLSGAGKSTLADLMAGLLAPTSGQLLVDGRAIDAAARPHWRASVTYVPQDAPLFHDTLRANLLIGARQATDAEIWRCLDLARVANLVRQLPAGLDTQAGDRGLRLSGGERQRLRLASALLRKPQLLILDEATSALNPLDESQIIAALRDALSQTTIVVVAHRPSSVTWTDQVIAIALGRIVGIGPPARIMADSGSLLSGMRQAEAVEPGSSATRKN